MQSSKIPARARRAAFKVFADAIAEHGGFATPLHRLALKCMRDPKAEPKFWDAVSAMDDEPRERLLERLQAIEANAPAVAREYARRGLV